MTSVEDFRTPNTASAGDSFTVSAEVSMFRCDYSFMRDSTGEHLQYNKLQRERPKTQACATPP